VSGTVDEYEVLYRETCNPLFVWEALECYQRDEPLPGWIRDYLLGAARTLTIDLGDAVCRKKLGAAEAARRTVRAFGFVDDPKYNAFSQLKQLRREFGETLLLELARTGPEREARLEKIQQSYVGKTGGTPGQIKRRAERALRLWNAQRGADK
jgi:hypothetical protein